MERDRKEMREKKQDGNKEKNSAYVDHCGLLVRAHPALAHPASSAAINMRFPPK